MSRNGIEQLRQLLRVAVCGELREAKNHSFDPARDLSVTIQRFDPESNEEVEIDVFYRLSGESRADSWEEQGEDVEVEILGAIDATGAVIPLLSGEAEDAREKILDDYHKHGDPRDEWDV